MGSKTSPRSERKSFQNMLKIISRKRVLREGAKRHRTLPGGGKKVCPRALLQTPATSLVLTRDGRQDTRYRRGDTEYRMQEVYKARCRNTMLHRMQDAVEKKTLHSLVAP